MNNSDDVDTATNPLDDIRRLGSIIEKQHETILVLAAEAPKLQKIILEMSQTIESLLNQRATAWALPPVSDSSLPIVEDRPPVVDMVGDGTRAYEIRNFSFWWNHVQKACEPRRTSGEQLAKIAWNAAIELCAIHCAASQLTQSSVDYGKVCRQFQVREGNAL